MIPIDPGRGPAILPPGHRAGPVTGTLTGLALAAVCLWLRGSPDLVEVGRYEPMARGILTGGAVLFGLLGVVGLAVVLLGGRRVPRWRADAEGIAVWHRWGHAEVPWDHVLGVGVGFELPPRVSTSVRIRRDQAVEVFVRDPDPEAAYPHARDLLWTEPAPRPGLPDRRIRVVGVETALERTLGEAVRAVRPDLWLGAYQRQWNVVPGV